MSDIKRMEDFLARHDYHRGLAGWLADSGITPAELEADIGIVARLGKRQLGRKTLWRVEMLDAPNQGMRTEYWEANTAEAAAEEATTKALPGCTFVRIDGSFAIDHEDYDFYYDRRELARRNPSSKPECTWR